MLFANKYCAVNLFLVIALAFVAACRSSENDERAPQGLVVVNAPVGGTVRRVLVSEGTNVGENAGIIEISVPSSVPAQAANNDPQTQARQSMQNTQAQISAAERDLERASIEVQRVEPLVASNSAPTAQLDAARAQYQEAQERLDQARRQSQTAQNGLAAQPDRQTGLTSAPAMKENIITVRASVAGNVRVISARAGQPIKAGQPLITISTK